MGIKLVAGRWFDESRPLDDMTLPYPADAGAAAGAGGARRQRRRQRARGARRLGFANPRDALGKTVQGGAGRQRISGSCRSRSSAWSQDSRFRSVRQPLDADHVLNARLRPQLAGRPLQGRSARRSATGVEAAWKSITTEVPFEADFSEDIVAELYEAEDARAKTFAGFALLAVVVACLGLFGLAAFTAERRTKEIGIRKVLGARSATSSGCSPGNSPSR